MWNPRYLSSIVEVHNMFASYPIVGVQTSFNDLDIYSPDQFSWKLCSIMSLCYKSKFSTPATSIKRSMIAHNFSPRYRYAEDLLFFLSNLIDSRKPLVYINTPLVILNRAQGSFGGLSANRIQMYSSSILVYFDIISRYYLTNPLVHNTCLITLAFASSSFFF